MNLFNDQNIWIKIKILDIIDWLYLMILIKYWNSLIYYYIW